MKTTIDPNTKTAPEVMKEVLESLPQFRDTSSRIDAEREQRRLDAMNEAWIKMCPPLYRETDSSRIKSGLLEAVMAWNPRDGSNLWITGPTGTRKTRIAYLLLHKLMMKGWGVGSINAVELAMKLSKPVWDGKEAELERLSKYSVLLIDDLGKEPNTQSIAQYFYLLIEKRYSNKKVNIITSNNETRARLGEDTERPTYRRLQEGARIVETSK